MPRDYSYKEVCCISSVETALLLPGAASRRLAACLLQCRWRGIKSVCHDNEAGAKPTPESITVEMSRVGITLVCIPSLRLTRLLGD